MMKVAADTFFVTYMLIRFINIAVFLKNYANKKNFISWQNAHFRDFVLHSDSCYMNDDHNNQFMALDCRECNPFFH